ncbi:MAG: MFS transporter [Verrucomicrobiales bacterium]|nr:MFS transporter [Verrucomicrobiales bacterium]
MNHGLPLRTGDFRGRARHGPPVPHADRAGITFRNDCGRMVCAGVLESAANTFLLLIAVRFFAAGAVAKALVAAGGSVGLLLSPVAVMWVSRVGWTATRGASRLFLIGAAACLVAAVLPTVWVYVPACMVAMTLSSAVIPLMTQAYHDNYPESERGKLYARSFMLRIAAAMIFSWAGGRFLDWRPTWFALLLVAFAAAFALSAWAVGRIPSNPIPPSGGSHPLHAMRYVREDRLFRQTLLVWMLMGFANLMMLPMRIEFLGNPVYGFSRSAAEIALLTGVIPNLARLVMNPVWGWLFDRVNFFALRIVLNVGFALGILAFFTSNDSAGLILGSVIYGISNAGGDVAWGLWVTKFAPAGRITDYMSVHTFLTGVRGVAAPLVAFQLIQRFPLQGLGIFSAVLIVAATLMLIPEMGRWKGRRSADPLTEEVTD